jgi:hypothetical protein
MLRLSTWPESLIRIQQGFGNLFDAVNLDHFSAFGIQYMLKLATSYSALEGTI